VDEHRHFLVIIRAAKSFWLLALRAHDELTVRCSTFAASDHLSFSPRRRRRRRLKMSGELPPLYGVSGDDHGAYCIISTATWACITGFTVVIRFALAWHHRLKVEWDDISFAIAAVSVLSVIRSSSNMLTL
jgi:hypothetical protein